MRIESPRGKLLEIDFRGKKGDTNCEVVLCEFLGLERRSIRGCDGVDGIGRCVEIKKTLDNRIALDFVKFVEVSRDQPFEIFGASKIGKCQYWIRTTWGEIIDRASALYPARVMAGQLVSENPYDVTCLVQARVKIQVLFPELTNEALFSGSTRLNSTARCAD